jgi:hypothetical protein
VRGIPGSSTSIVALSSARNFRIEANHTDSKCGK